MSATASIPSTRGARVKLTAVDRLKASPINPRQISDDRFSDLTTALQADPDMLWARPIIHLPDGVVICGNMRLRGAQHLGWAKVPAFEADLDADTARVWMLRDNQEYGDWSPELGDLLRGMRADGIDLGLTGLTLEEIETAMATGDSDARPDADPEAVPDPPARPTTKRGDVWQLGRHRIICGDATDPKVLAKLLDGQAVDLVLTDPPYGIDYGASVASNPRRKTRKPIANDDLAKPGLEEFLQLAFAAALEHTRPGGAIYVCHASQTTVAFHQALAGAGWDIKQTLVWVKQSFVLGRQDYHWQHEPITYGWKPGAAHRWFGQHAKTTVIDSETDPEALDHEQLVDLVNALRAERGTDVIRADRPSASDLHPTTKPVGLLTPLLANSSRPDEWVLDMFAGSGSTLIAAEQLGRSCAAIELDPAYVDVVCRRYEDYTGNQPTRRGRAHSFLEAVAA